LTFREERWCPDPYNFISDFSQLSDF